MRRIIVLSICAMVLLSSCVSQKKYNDLQSKQRETQDLLNSATVKLNKCLSDAAVANARVEGMKEQLADLRKANQDLINTKGNLTTLTQKGAETLEKSLESLKEKDLKISRLQDALNKKDSVNLALVYSLKKEVGMDDPDIEINVDKGVVLISLSDKLLFKSGSYNVTTRANEILGKVAKVIKSRPTFDVLVESHTDNVPYRRPPLLDNWDLSVKRATSIVRVLEKLGAQPQQLIASGRSSYKPLVDNSTAENRARNRRTRIVILPKIDEFYSMIEQEMKNLSTEN